MCYLCLSNPISLGGKVAVMKVIKTAFRKHPLVFYYVITFAISRGGILTVIGGPSGIPGRPGRFEKMIPLVALALLAGPSLTGILMTGPVQGRAGLRDLSARVEAAAMWVLAAAVI